MSEPPAVADLQAVAERALGHAECEAQATATWSRDGSGERLTVEVTCVIEGRAARAVAPGADDEALRRAARAAALHARRPRAWPSEGLPEPVPGSPGPLPRASLRSGVERVAIASTRGVRSGWERHLHPPEDRDDLRPSGHPVQAPTGDLPIVFGHAAVATIVDHLRPAFGVELDLGGGALDGRMGTRVAAAGIHLCAAAAGFDAEGIPRSRVVLIDAGVAAGRVHDTASARRAGVATTGHATRAAALAPLPEHLVLSPGDADDVETLCGALERGLYVPALSPQREAHGNAFRHRTRGAALIAAGRLSAPLADCALQIEPLAVLASAEALTARTRTVPLAGDGSAEVPALLARSRSSAG